MAPKKKKESIKKEESDEEEEFEIVEINIDSSTPQLDIADYADFKLPMVEWLVFEPPWEDWPAWPPPPEWKYAEPFDALLEACAPHKLPLDIDLSYGPPLPWIVKPPREPPKEEIPVRQFLMDEKVHDLVLEAMQLIVIERPERPVKFVALYIREKNPKACKVKCKRHYLGESCHCKNLPPPPPPPPEPKPEPEEGGEEEAAA